MGVKAYIAAKIGLNTTEFSKGMSDAKKLSDDMRSTMDSLKKSITAAFSVAAISGFIKSVKGTADELIRVSQETGSTSTGLQSLRGAFLDNGLAVSNLEPGLRKVQSAIIDLANGTPKTVEAFGALGITLDDVRGKGTDEVFAAIAAAIQNADDKTAAISATQDLLGKKLTGALLPALKIVGEEGWDKLTQRMEESGRVMDRAFLSRLNEAEGKLQAFTDRLKVATVTIADWFRAVGQGIGSWWEYANLEGLDLIAANMAGETDWDAFLKGYEGFYDQQIDLRREAAARERQINTDILQNAVENLEKEVEAVDEATKAEIKAREEAAKAAEREAKKAADAKIKEEERALKGLADAQKAYYDEWRKAEAELMEELDPAERVKRLESAWQSLSKTVAQMDYDLSVGAAEGVEAETRLLQAKKQLLELEGDLRDARKEAADEATKAQDVLHNAASISLEDFEKLRTVIAGMTDKELADLSAKLQSLSDTLKGVDFSGLAGLAALQNFKFPSVTSGQMRQLARALTELGDGLKGVTFPDFSALRDLSGLDLPDFTAGQMRQLARALTDLSNGLKGVTFPDFSGLATLAGLDLPNLTGSGVREFADALGDLGEAVGAIDADKAELVARLLEAGPAAGNLSIELTAPDPEKLVLKVDDGLKSSLDSLAASAATLASLKGVIFA